MDDPNKDELGFTSEDIRIVNDKIRTCLTSLILYLCPTFTYTDLPSFNGEQKRIHGKVVLTSGVHALDSLTKQKLFCAIAEFNDFNNANDPYGEHDCATIKIDGDKYIFKFSYYDDKFERYGHHAHVLTIMKASEY